MTESSTDFDCLVLGLAEYLDRKQTYPFPDLFRHACNTLALKLTTVPYPQTISGLLDLMKEPVRTWWPSGLPPEFDSDYGLVYDNELSEEASRYLYQEVLEREKLPLSATSVQQRIVIENYQFRRLIDQLQDVYEHDPEQAQQEYVCLRAFLIEHPYATTEQLRAACWALRYLSAQEVGGLYGEDLPPDPSYWLCEQCGPLTRQYGQLRGIKPSVCNDHRTELPHIRLIPWQRGLRRITIGIHWRVCLPGTPEMRLFHQLEALRQQHPEQLCAVLLWPGIDRYDLQLRFANGSVWAIDLKDYPKPDALALHLTPIYGEGDLRYDESFYVVPVRCLDRDNYLQIAREHATNLPTSTHLISDIAFEQRVAEQITRLQKGQ